MRFIKKQDNLLNAAMTPFFAIRQQSIQLPKDVIFHMLELCAKIVLTVQIEEKIK